MLAPLLGRDDPERRLILNAVGPFFPGNEVWLVAFVGVLFGAFPRLEGVLLPGMYPIVVVILLGLIVGNVAVQLRRRHKSARARRAWDGVVLAGGLVPAAGWGVAVGVLLGGLPCRHVLIAYTLYSVPFIRRFVARPAVAPRNHDDGVRLGGLPGRKPRPAVLDHD